MRIGVDVGGTNTDAVVLDGTSIKGSVKTATTPDIESGVVTAIQKAMADAQVPLNSIRSVMIGTTQFTNAFIEARGLMRVGTLRLGAPATLSLPPMVAWPKAIRDAVFGHAEIVPGGYQVDGTPIQPLDEASIRVAAKKFKAKSLDALAVSSVFAPLNADDEHRAAEILREELPDAALTLSNEIGRLGLLERESAAIMNSSLSLLSKKVIQSFVNALKSLGLEVPLFITQNDGTLMKAETVQRFPVLTFASGPTNSMRGAAFLTGRRDAVVADIGGTTTDCGVLSNGFPRESSINVDIGGVRTNFRMPDILAIGLGGGSLVRQSANEVHVGPQSVGHGITQEALVFGGDTLTTTDIAVAANRADIGDKSLVGHLPQNLVASALSQIRSMVEDVIDRMKTSGDDVPVILVGGGTCLVEQELAGASEVLIPDYAGVANAVGAAIAQVGGEVDRVVSFDEKGRDATLASVKQEATDRAIASGADPQTIQIIDVDEIPLAYLQGQSARVRVKAVGDLPLEEHH